MGQCFQRGGVSLYHEARAGGMVYQTVLRRELARLLGVEWGPIDPHTGMAELAGVDRQVLKAWSQRSSQLSEWAAENLVLVADEASAAQLAAAQKATRPRKPEGVPWSVLRRDWAADARGFRLDPAAQRDAARMRQHDRRESGDVAAAAVAALTKAVFTRADLVEAIGAHLPVDDRDGRSPRELIEGLADVVAVRVTDPRAAHQREGSVRYSAPELIEEEAVIVAVMGARDARGVIPVDAVDTAGLSPDQARAVRSIVSSARLVQPLAAPAGAGKTHSLKALRAAANAAGKQIVVTAPTARAVGVAVREKAGDAGSTLHALLSRIGSGEQTLDTATVVVVDEAAMVGTAQLRELLTAAAAAGTKVVLVGDSHQLAPVAARDGTFAALCADLPWAQRLSEVWRMEDHEERASSLAVGDGGPAALRRAVSWYRRHDRLHYGDAVTMAQDALEDWRADLAAGRDALLIADRWEIADAVNERIHTERARPDAPTIKAARGHHLGVDDIVITRQNTADIEVYTDRSKTVRADPIRNGQRWRVSAVNAKSGAVMLRRLEDDAHSVVHGDYLHNHVHLGYAVTVHAAQGGTADTCLALLSAETAVRSNAYVALTRGRESNSVYLYDTASGEADHEHAETHTGVHVALRGTGNQAAEALRRILGRDDRSATIIATTASTDEQVLPAQVIGLRQRHRGMVDGLRREHRADQESAADLARLHAADRVLVQMLDLAGRPGDSLAIADQSDPVRTATGVPFVVATLDAQHYSPEAAAAITAAAAAAGRSLLKLGSNTGALRLDQLAEQIRAGTLRPAPRGAIIVIENAANADPKDLATVSAAHGKLLLVDDAAADGPARRLLDGLALPWSHSERTPPPSIHDPDLAATADYHRTDHAQAWALLTRISRRGRTNEGIALGD